ncbi:serine/threonine-protein phosphatase 2A regulatory subunit B [Pancytospora philotis]|nr:serine/threonine-protein phosphatase 2A regulatory subunit B [Pancytospora philotis]
MFARSFEYVPPVPERYVEGVSVLLAAGNKLFAGREDGVVDCLGAAASYSQPVFEPDFDLLENVPIKEKIMAMERTTDGGMNEILYVANEKNICVMRVRNDAPTLSICQDSLANERVRIAGEKRFNNAHTYLVNSLSLSCDEASLLSADFLRINLWRPERMDKYLALVDIKSSMQTKGISYVINSARFSPFSDHLFAYGTSSGAVTLHDTAIEPCSSAVASFTDSTARGIKSASDLCFPRPGIIVARSLNSLAIYDMRSSQAPLLSVELAKDAAEQAQLNNSRAIYQTFRISCDEFAVYTGSCFNTVYVVDIATGEATEVLVGAERSYSLENRIRNVVRTPSGFACVHRRQICRYDRI